MKENINIELLEMIERVTPELINKQKGTSRAMCANVDLYSGFVYDMLGIPEDLFTPLFTVSRIAGWSAHRMEELINASKIIRPAYMSVTDERDYLHMEER